MYPLGPFEKGAPAAGGWGFSESNYIAERTPAQSPNRPITPTSTVTARKKAKVSQSRPW